MGTESRNLIALELDDPVVGAGFPYVRVWAVVLRVTVGKAHRCSHQDSQGSGSFPVRIRPTEVTERGAEIGKGHS